jgi:hypothetical protein
MCFRSAELEVEGLAFTVVVEAEEAEEAEEEDKEEDDEEEEEEEAVEETSALKPTSSKCSCNS